MMRILLPTALVMLLAACNKVKEPPPSKVTIVPTPQSAKPAPPREPHIDLEGLPVSEDYEVEAAKEITSANLAKKVDELATEISAK